jgi:hypothetical protein
VNVSYQPPHENDRQLNNSGNCAAPWSVCCTQVCAVPGRVGVSVNKQPLSGLQLPLLQPAPWCVCLQYHELHLYCTFVPHLEYLSTRVCACTCTGLATAACASPWRICLTAACAVPLKVSGLQNLPTYLPYLLYLPSNLFKTSGTGSAVPGTGRCTAHSSLRDTYWRSLQEPVLHLYICFMRA